MSKYEFSKKTMGMVNEMMQAVSKPHKLRKEGLMKQMNDKTMLLLTCMEEFDSKPVALLEGTAETKPITAFDIGKPGANN